MNGYLASQLVYIYKNKVLIKQKKSPKITS